jgi:antibiotic biosynthesis monooxygenase (ABM) superfamily enzyme
MSVDASGTATTTEPDAYRADKAVTLVLSRTVKAGHEQAFEDVLRRLTAAVRRQPGHLAVATLAPLSRAAPIYTIVSHFASRPDADAWLSSQSRARLVAEAGLHSPGDLQTQYVSGLEAWLTRPGAPVIVPPARWRTVVLSAVALLPLLEAISYLLAPRLAALPVWARPLISVVIVIPLMQYVVMPALARPARRFLYPKLASERGAGES